jgi:hypothetical protein
MITGRVISKTFRVCLCKLCIQDHHRQSLPTRNQLQRKPPHQLPAAATYTYCLSHTLCMPWI